MADDEGELVEVMNTETDVGPLLTVEDEEEELDSGSCGGGR